MAPFGRGSTRVRALCLGLGLGFVVTVAARADGPRPAASEAERDAFIAFQDGEHAFARGEFVRAAEAFESAYRRAPHPDALWNAAQAWSRAGEDARAANLHAKYLREAPSGAPDRGVATAELQKLSARLGRIDVVARGVVEDVAVDDRPLDGDRAYVTPGTHVVRGRAGERAITKSVTIQAGATVSVALSPGEPRPTPPARRGPGLAVVVAGGAATAVAGGLLIWSGADTLRQRALFDDERTPQHLEDGRDKQTRTNVLIGVTAGLGALTAGAAVLLLDWRRPPAHARLAPGPAGLRSVSVAGEF